MESTPISENSYEYLTEHALVIDRSNENIPKSMTYIAALRGKRVILIHFPVQKSVSIGRSRQNDIQLPDPHFPRRAAEIILGPLPLMRKMARTGQKNHEVVPITPGKSFKIYPYNFCLLKTGDILANRHNKGDYYKERRKILFAVYAFIILAVFCVYNFHSTSEGKNLVPDESVQIENKKHSNILHDIKPKYEGLSKALSENPSFEKGLQNGRLEKTKFQEQVMEQGFEVNTSNNIKDKEAELTKDETVLQNQGILLEDLEILIKFSIRFIEKRHPEQAGQTIIPIIAHLNREQKIYVIQCLEPSLHSLYQEAYMLRRYNDKAAMTVLNRIVASKLELLPSYTKAKKLFESEKEIANTLGTTSGLKDIF